MEDLIRLDNDLNSQIKSLEGDMQNLVYENYNKFISATDIIKSIKNNMTDLDSELSSLKTCMSEVNSSFNTIDDRLKYKWREIRKLDTLEQDLGKLKNLGELPTAFKESLDKFEASEDIEDLEGPIKQFLEYKDVIHQYKNTNFLTNLSSEINKDVQRVRVKLRQEIERTNDHSQESFFKMVKYLIRLGEDEDDMRTEYSKFKTEKMKSRVEAIRDLSSLTTELEPKEHKRLLDKYGDAIKESDYQRESEEQEEEEAKEGATKFEKK